MPKPPSPGIRGPAEERFGIVTIAGRDRHRLTLSRRNAPMSVTLLLHQRVQLQTTDGSLCWDAFEARGSESISRPYRFRVRLRTDPSGVDRLDDLVGKAAVLGFAIPGQSPAVGRKEFCGVVTSGRDRGSDDQYAYYDAILRPQFWTRRLNRRYRQFVDQTTEQIVKSVLGPLAVRWELAAAAEPRSYCVQYGESDFHFVSRLLEEDGLFYFFEHQFQPADTKLEERHERLVITDSIDRVNGDGEPPTFLFDSVRGGRRSQMRIRTWRRHRRMAPQRVISLDRNFQRPGQLVRDESGSDGSRQEDRTVTRYPSGTAWRADSVSVAGQLDPSRLNPLDGLATADARRRTAEWACQTQPLGGSGDVAALSPAMKFKLRRGLVTDAAAHYATHIEHLIRLTTPRRSGFFGADFRYENRFRCLPEATPFRPRRRTRKPRIAGVVPATVFADSASVPESERGGQGSQEFLLVDPLGRVKVRFPWQADGDGPGCWIRVSQFWAGPRWGAFFWPRAGHEVLVAFEHGDPDRPVIVGSVYNGANLPPLKLPDHKLSCGIHSSSYRGDPTRQTSCVVFHDREGEEYLQLHSETYHSLTSETETMKWAAGHDITFKGHHWLFDLPAIGGSGGGGSDFTGNNGGANAQFKKSEESKDFDVGEFFKEMVKDLLLFQNEGSTTYSVGDTYSKRFGRQIGSFYGNTLSIGCDPAEVIEFAAEKSGKMLLSWLTTLVLGAGGQGKALWGGIHDIQYGTQVKSYRGHLIQKQTPHPKQPESRWGEGSSPPADRPVAIVCHPLMLLILLMDLLVMMLTKAALSHDGSHWLRYLKFSEVWTLMIMPRLQGLLQFLESTTGEIGVIYDRARDALRRAREALARAVRAVQVLAASVRESLEAAGAAVTDALDNVRATARRIADALSDD